MCLIALICLDLSPASDGWKKENQQLPGRRRLGGTEAVVGAEHAIIHSAVAEG